MVRSVSYDKMLQGYLKDPREAAAYLNAVLEEGNPQLFLSALGKVVKAQGGIGKLASKTKFTRAGLYKVLSKRGNPEFRTIEDILHALHLKLTVHLEKSDRRSRSRAG